MKFCHNPECVNCVDVSEDICRRGVMHVPADRAAGCCKSRLVKRHEYRHPDSRYMSIWLCSACHRAVQMIERLR